MMLVLDEQFEGQWEPGSSDHADLLELVRESPDEALYMYASRYISVSYF